MTSWPWSPPLVKDPWKHQLMYLQQQILSQNGHGKCEYAARVCTCSQAPYSAASTRCPHVRVHMQSHGVLQDCMRPGNCSSAAGHGAGNSPAISAIVEGAVLHSTLAFSHTACYVLAFALMSNTGQPILMHMHVCRGTLPTLNAQTPKVLPAQHPGDQYLAPVCSSVQACPGRQANCVLAAHNTIKNWLSSLELADSM